MEELYDYLAPLVNNLIIFAIVLSLFVMGLGMPFKEAFSLWRNPKKLAVTLLSA